MKKTDNECEIEISRDDEDDLRKILESQKDPRLEAYDTLAKMLIDETKLLLTANFRDQGTIISILQNMVLILFFKDYYIACKCEIRLEKQSMPPYYRKVTNVKFPDKDKVLNRSYEKFINIILMTTRSYKGQFSKDVLNILKAADIEIDLKQNIRDKVKNYL